jgi:deoxycytidine triphosphate deaminase
VIAKLHEAVIPLARLIIWDTLVGRNSVGRIHIMLLVEEQITEANLVSPQNQVKLRNSTCDLTIGSIFPAGIQSKGAGEEKSVFWLKPNHMVFVVSQQRVTLPNNVTGLANLVTTLTKKGILCLNTGIIDSGYDGHIGATLVNFSNKERPIELNERLFRVLFFKHDDLKNCEPVRVEKSTYLAASRQQSSDEFDETFLDVFGLLKQAETSAWSVVLNKSTTTIVPWLALLVAVVGAIFGVLAYFNTL